MRKDIRHSANACAYVTEPTDRGTKYAAAVMNESVVDGDCGDCPAPQRQAGLWDQAPASWDETPPARDQWCQSLGRGVVGYDFGACC